MGAAPERVDSLRRLSGSLRRIAGDDAPDCVQEAYTRAITSGVALDAEPWIRTVSKRIAIDRVRRSREFASGAPAELEGFVREHDGDPQEAFVRAERSAEVREALEKLPERYRDALLTYAEEESPSAVASRLGLSANAAWTLLSRARSRLRLQLEQVGYAPVAFLSRVRWKGFAAGGAAAAAAAVATTTIVPHAARPPIAPRPPAIVQQASAPKAPGPAAITTQKKAPLVAVPKLPVAVPKVNTPKVPPAPAPSTSACARAADGPLSAVTDGVRTLLGTVVSKVPPVAKIGSRLCR